MVRPLEKAFWAGTWKKFRQSAVGQGLVQRKDRILLLVSGGPDSVAMAFWFKLLACRLPFQWAIAHFDHGLRPESQKDAAWVAALARRLGVVFYGRSLPVRLAAARRRRGLEEAGRFLRYRAARALARRHHYNKVATAHTLDDQAETVLLNLLRGLALRGLAGIRFRRRLAPRSSIFLIRPLLGISKKQILAYLKASGESYRVDRSNQDEWFLRNKIRHKLLPCLQEINPNVVTHLAGIAAQIAVQYIGETEAETNVSYFSNIHN